MVAKLGHAAGLLIIMRPFLATHGLRSTRMTPEVPRGTPTKQIASTLLWYKVFFNAGGTKIERFFRLDAYLRTGPIIEIGMDASHGAWEDGCQ